MPRQMDPIATSLLRRLRAEKGDTWDLDDVRENLRLVAPGAWLLHPDEYERYCRSIYAVTAPLRLPKPPSPPDQPPEQGDGTDEADGDTEAGDA